MASAETESLIAIASAQADTLAIRDLAMRPDNMNAVDKHRFLDQFAVKRRVQTDECNGVAIRVAVRATYRFDVSREAFDYDNMQRRADTAKFNVEISIGTTNMMKTKNVRKRGTVADDE